MESILVGTPNTSLLGLAKEASSTARKIVGLGKTVVNSIRTDRSFFPYMNNISGALRYQPKSQIPYVRVSNLFPVNHNFLRYISGPAVAIIGCIDFVLFMMFSALHLGRRLGVSSPPRQLRYSCGWAYYFPAALFSFQPRILWSYVHPHRILIPTPPRS